MLGKILDLGGQKEFKIDRFSHVSQFGTPINFQKELTLENELNIILAV